MSDNDQDKTQLPQEDANVELTEDDLSKVSGGFTYQKITPSVRELGVRELGIRDGNLTGFKVEIEG